MDLLLAGNGLLLQFCNLVDRKCTRVTYKMPSRIGHNSAFAKYDLIRFLALFVKYEAVGRHPNKNVNSDGTNGAQMKVRLVNSSMVGDHLAIEAPF